MIPQRCMIDCLKMYKTSDSHYWSYEKLYSGIDRKRKTLAERKIQRGIFQGNALPPLLFVIRTVPLSHILRKCTGGYKFTNSLGKNQPPNVHGRHQTVCKKWKRTGSSNTKNKNIQLWYSNEIWHRKMCHANNEKWKRQIIEGIKLPKKESERTEKGKLTSIWEY